MGRVIALCFKVGDARPLQEVRRDPRLLKWDARLMEMYVRACLCTVVALNDALSFDDGRHRFAGEGETTMSDVVNYCAASISDIAKLLQGSRLMV